MSDFEKRLQQAITRGQTKAKQQAVAAHAAALSEEQLKRLHSQYRLQLTDHIERCLERLVDHFPGFRTEAVVGDRGWGAAVTRDDVQLGPQRGSLFSRLEITVRPYSSAQVIEVNARGTIRNKEVFQRTQFQLLNSVQIERLCEQLDLWILEYAELFAAQS